MLCSPCVVDGFGPDGASGVLAYSFLHRSASSKTGMTRAGASVTFNVGYCYARDGYLCLPQMLKKGPALNAGTFGIGCVAGAAVSDKYDALLEKYNSERIDNSNAQQTNTILTTLLNTMGKWVANAPAAAA
jgi:hypothetical protein